MRVAHLFHLLVQIYLAIGGSQLSASAQTVKEKVKILDGTNIRSVSSGSLPKLGIGKNPDSRVLEKEKKVRNIRASTE